GLCVSGSLDAAEVDSHAKIVQARQTDARSLRSLNYQSSGRQGRLDLSRNAEILRLTERSLPVSNWCALSKANSSQVPSHRTLMVGARHYFRPGNLLQEIAMPQFEHQQTPDPSRMVAASPKVLVQQLSHGGWIEIRPLHCFRLQQNGHDQVLQFVSH